MAILPYSIDTQLVDILHDVKVGKIQLPEFQRSWTWDDNRIKAILASVTQGYPIGAIMQLEYGNADIKFKYRTVEGVGEKNIVPSHLILDGQQRLTSMFQAAYSDKPVRTKTDKGKEIERYYYLDINKCLDKDADREEAILSVPKDKKIKENFDRDVILDLSSRELEFKHEMFPINIMFDSNDREDWADGYKEQNNNTQEVKDKYKRFRSEILDTVKEYKLPVITLLKATPREAVCKVFENVNTGGVALTVFELVTAMFATHEFDLREDWEKCKEVIWGTEAQLNTDIMEDVDETSFLTAVTLYTSFANKQASGKGSISCKKKDVLKLDFNEYQKNKDKLLDGYKLARTFLFSQYVFRKRDLPYSTQLIPLSVICAAIGKQTFDKPGTQSILEQWFWCGIMGEMYGGANETRYANDVEDVIAAIKGEPNQNRTIASSFFSATRLLSLQTRLSAAYKGLMALIYRTGSKDFIKGTTMNVVKSMDELPDIHHIFPEAYCKSRYSKTKWNSIVNKTPLLPVSNRIIGGVAPSLYSRKILKEANIDESLLRERIESNLIDYDTFIKDDFDAYFVARSKSLLSIIEKAMGKVVADRGSEQTIKEFGCSLE